MEITEENLALLVKDLINIRDIHRNQVVTLQDMVTENRQVRFMLDEWIDFFNTIRALARPGPCESPPGQPTPPPAPEPDRSTVENIDKRLS